MTSTTEDGVRKTTDWQPFDYANPPEGMCWLEIERPDTWCDVDDYGKSIGGYTGDVDRLVVLAGVYRGEHGPEFDPVDGCEFGEVEDHDTVRRFMPLTAPPLAIQEPKL